MKQKKINMKDIGNLTHNTEMKKLFKILGYIITTLCFVYVITFIISGEINVKNSNQNTPVAIQYQEILAGETFGQPEKTYYVLFYRFDDSNASTLKSTIDNYAKDTTNIKLYTVDLSNGFNRSFIADNNVDTSNVSTLKVNNYTLIKIENGQRTMHIEGLDNIDKQI